MPSRIPEAQNSPVQSINISSQPPGKDPVWDKAPALIPFPLLKRFAGHNLWLSLWLVSGASFLLPHGTFALPRPVCRFQVTKQKIYPGSLFLVSAHCAEPVSKATATFRQKQFIFFAGKNQMVSYAFVGADLESRPGSYPLEVELELGGSRKQEWKESVRIFPKQFPVQKITVAEKYAKPDPADQQRAEAEAKKLEALWKVNSAGRYWDTPFELPVKSELTSGFGRRRVVNGESRSPHSGVDLKADVGAPIRATNKGKVVVAEEMFFSGNTIVIDHGLGLYTFYGHCSKILVRVEETVNSGQVIGEVGATGRVTGPHLHWACRLNETRVNPLDLLSLVMAD
ncbi:MAG: M23 family metallopeptidase [Terriglobia bacterium]